MVELSAATGIGKPKLGHLESGRYFQTEDDIEKVLTACGGASEDIRRLQALAAQSDGKTWWAPWSHVVAPWVRLYLGLEGFAESLFVFEPIVLPGLLQTTAYAEAITKSSIVVRPDFVTRLVELRRARADRLTSDEPLKYHAVIGEPALRLQVGDKATRREQLQHLLTLAKRPNITVQVLRLEDGPYAALGAGRFDLFRFANAAPIAYSELLDDAVYVHDSDQVGTYTVVTEDLKRLAYSPQESQALLEKLVE